LYWIDAGLSPTTIGLLWAGGILSEVLAFSLSRRLVERWGPAPVIGLGCAAGLLRWTILGLDGGLAGAVVVQALQGGTLALNQAAVAKYIASSVPEGLVSSAAGLYAAFGYGLLLAACIFVGGQLYPTVGGGIYLIASGLCAFGLVCATLLAVQIRGDSKAEGRAS
jgi:PPP family 3-phenylpropionic acid transporter